MMDLSYSSVISVALGSTLLASSGELRSFRFEKRRRNTEDSRRRAMTGENDVRSVSRGRRRDRDVRD